MHALTNIPAIRAPVHSPVEPVGYTRDASCSPSFWCPAFQRHRATEATVTITITITITNTNAA